MRIKGDYGRPLFAAELATNLRLFFFVFLAVGLMIVDHRSQRLEPLRNVLATAVYPLQYSVQWPLTLIRNSADLFARQSDLVADNKQLRQKQLFINAQLQKLTALEAENRRLRLLLESSSTIRERVLIAELLAVDNNPYRHQVLLNKGSRDGVYVGQPLLDQNGVVGQIIHANTLSARAILITDPNHALPIQVTRNGLRTLAVGSGNFQALELPYVPTNQDVRKGDLLITSGLGGRFPRGYPVARVTEVEFDPASSFARISARPTTELDRIREVLLVVSEALPEADSLIVGPFKQP